MLPGRHIFGWHRAAVSYAGRQAVPGTKAILKPAHIVHASAAPLVWFLEPWLQVAGECL